MLNARSTASKLIGKCKSRLVSNTAQHTMKFSTNNSGSAVLTNSLVANIESCTFSINDHYRRKKEQEFNDGLLDLKQYCSQLNDETEGKVNEKLWNFVIQQFCRNEAFTNDATYWFRRIMKEKKLANPNGFTLNAVLKSFASIGELEMCEEILQDLENQGLSNVFSYIYYTKACLQNGKSEKAFNVIGRMESRNIEPSFGIYIPLLKEATNLNNMEVGLKLCDMIKKSNLYSPQLSSSIATFALKMKRPDIAIAEYEKMKKSGSMNIVNWTCLMQAYIQQNEIKKAVDTIGEMKKHNINPDSATFTILLNACAKTNMYEEGVKIHELATKTLKEITISLTATIINFYTKCGHEDIAIAECEKLKQKGLMNVVTWTCLMQAYIQQGDVEKAVDTIGDMRGHNVNPDSATFTILLSACAKSNMYEEGVNIHELAKQTLKEFTIELHSAIINFYTTCGYSDIAITECEKLRKKGLMNVVTWNYLIQAHIQQKAIHTIDMNKSAVNPNSITFTVLLSSCGNLKLLDEGIEIHELAKKTLKEFTIELHNAIITFYTKCGYEDIAITECEKLKQKGLMNVVTWTCLMQAYIQKNDIKKAINTIDDMKKHNINPDSATFIVILNACGNLKLLDEGIEIHELAKRTLQEFTTLLTATIINFYTKCGRQDIAIEECEKLKQNGLMNVVTWTCLIQAYIQQNEIKKAICIIGDMNKSAIAPNSTTFLILLSACAKSNMYEEGVKIHELAKQTLKEFTIELHNAIINFYTKCGNEDIAIEECEKLKQKGSMNTITWNCLIQAYIQQNNIKKAIDTIGDMRKHNINPDSATFTILLSACAKSNMYEEGVKIHELAKQTLKEFTIELHNAIITFYIKCGNEDIAIEECEKVKQKGLMNIVTWTCFIQAYIKKANHDHTPSDAEHGLNKAFGAYQEMKQRIAPDDHIFTMLLAACGEYVATNIGVQIIEDITLYRMDANEEVISGMVYYHSRIGQKETTEQLLDELVRKKDESKKALSLFTYTNMLSCYAQHGKGYEAKKLFDEIVEKKVELDEIILTVVLNAYSHCGMVEEAIQLYNDMKPKHNFSPTLSIDCVMIDVFSRAGRFEEAEGLIRDRNDIGLWGALMGGCRKFNNIELGEKVFNKMTSIDENETSPYILLSHIYTYHGLNEKATKLQQLMRKRGIKKLPGIVYHEENGTVYKFISGPDNYKEDSVKFEKIERMRDEMFCKIIKAGYKPDTRWVTRTELSEEEKVNLLNRHAEKTAIAHAFVLNPNRKKILLTTNLRVCNDCHSAMNYISKVMDVEIIVRDANRYHHFKDGKCSCGDYW